MRPSAWSRRAAGLLCLIVGLGIAGLGLVNPAVAETRYLIEEQRFNIRSGEGLDYRVTGSLSSGEAVEVLSVNRASGYSRIQTADGEVGYVLSRFLQEAPSMRVRLAEARARLAALEDSTLGECSTGSVDVSLEYAALQADYAQVVKEKEQLEQDLAEVRHAAANAVRINRERRELQSQVEALTLRVEELRQDQLEVSNRENQRWFLIGSVVVIGSLLIGFLLPNIRLPARQQTNRWDTL